MAKEPSFRRSIAWVTALHLGGLAICGLFTMLQAKPKQETIVWLDGGAMAAIKAQQQPPAEELIEEPEPPKEDIPEKEEPVPTPPPAEAQAESEIATATPTPTPTPKATPTPTPKATPKPKPKPKPKLKATPTPTPAKKAPAKPKEPVKKPKPAEAEKPKPSPPAKKPGPDSDETTAKPEAAKPGENKAAASTAGSAEGTGTGTGTTGSGSGSGPASELGWYHTMIHDRFYGKWVQPTTIPKGAGEFITTIKIRIEKDGRVSNVSLASSSGNVVMDESVMTAARRVTQIDPLPSAITNSFYEINIDFELDQ